MQGQPVLVWVDPQIPARTAPRLLLTRFQPTCLTGAEDGRGVRPHRGHGLDMECRYGATNSGRPCGNPIGPGSDHCAAGHPVVPEKVVVGASLSSAPRGDSSFDLEEVVASNPPVFDRTMADGERRVVAFVPVDTATMLLGGRWPEDDTELSALMFKHRVARDVACSRTAGSDGRYEVLELSGPAEVHGVEVVFCSRVLQDEVAARMRNAGVVKPTSETYAKYFTGDQSVRLRVELYHHVLPEIHREVWDQRATGIHPADDSEPVVLGEIEVDGKLYLGDPCYNSPSVEVEVPSGRYTVVVWRDGDETCRLGVYRSVA